MGRKLTEAQRRLILAMPTSQSSRDVAALVGCGRTAVAEVRAEGRGQAARAPRRSTRPVEVASPEPEPERVEPEDERAALWEAINGAQTHEELREAAVNLQRFDDPKFAFCLDHGMTTIEALLETHAVPYDLLASPLDLAFIAHMATDILGGLEREEGESKEHFEAAWRQEHTKAHARMIALLEGALTLAKATNPQDPFAELLITTDRADPFYAEFIASGGEL